MMCSNLGHVTEVKSNINEKISFRMMQDGNSVNTGRFVIKGLHGPGLVTVNVHEAIHRLRTMPRLEISVLINGKPKMILKPIYLVMHVRIIFNYCYDGGTPTLVVKGLDTKKKDCILRISFLKERRGREYGNRENDPQHARIIWEGPLEEEEVVVQRDNNETSEAVGAPVDFCFMVPNVPIPELNDDLLINNEAPISSTIAPSSLSVPSYDLGETIDVVGQPSSAFSLALTYKEPSVVDGLGDVAVIPSSGINDNIVGQMSNGLIGRVCDDRPLKFTSRRESLIVERLKEFGDCQVWLLRDGFYALFFSSDECKIKVLEHGQLFIDNRPLIIRRWTQQLSMVPSQFLKSLPVWIEIRNFDLKYWSIDSLSIISSVIGTPVSMDNFTASIISDGQSILQNWASTSARQLDIARVCVEIDPYRDLPDTVNVSVEGKLVSVSIEYEWKPQPCTHCRSLYHDSNSCDIDREDVYSHQEDLRSQGIPVQDQGIPTMIMPSPHSSDGDIPDLISDDDEDDDGIIVTGNESGPQSTELSIPESLNEALVGDVEILASTQEVEPTRLGKMLSKIISRVLPSRRKHFNRSITL